MESTQILPLLLVSVTLSEVAGRYPIVKCEEDHQCRENEFCYESGLCAPCTNCTTYFRKPHKWKYCSKSPDECGGCLPGYAADTLTDGSERELCTQIQQSEESKSVPVGPGDWSTWGFGVMVIGLPLAVLLGVLIFYRKTGAQIVNRGVLKMERPFSGPANTRPPPYSSCGESPLLTRNIGDLQYRSGSVWHTDHQMTSSSYPDNSSYPDEEPVKICVAEKTIDGVQQARPFEYHPDELKETNPQSRTRTSCRPDDGRDHHDEDDDNEDGLSVSHENGVNEVDHCNFGSSNGTEHMDNQSEEAAAAKQGNIMLRPGCRRCTLNRKAGSSEHMFDRRGSLCNTALRSDNSTYSLCSETDRECRCQAPVQCSCNQNVLNALLPSKYDSGFISKCSVKIEESHDDTSTENTQTRRDNKQSSTDGGYISINLPVNINILNHVNIR